MPFKLTFPRMLTTFGLLLSSLTVIASAPIARATGPTVWWVASSGTPANPASNGSSCINPSYVGNSDTALQSAISASASGDEIRICSGRYSFSATVLVDRDLTLVGSGSTLPVLDGGNTTRIMTIGPGGQTVTLNGLQFQNARTSRQNEGGAAVNADASSNLTVVNSYFVKNTASWHGGAIAVIGENGTGSLTVQRSTFLRNQAEDGGAIVVAGLAQASSIQNSTFVANVATRAAGAISGSFANVTASNSTFVDNRTLDAGFSSAVWSVSTKGSIFANSPSTATPSVNTCRSEGETHSENVSTHASCLSSDQQPVTYESLGLKFLGIWGSRVPTIPFGANSSAINTVTTSGNCSTVDQHGQTRSSPCDAGAVEYQVNQAAVTAPTVMIVEGRQIPATTLVPTGLTSPITFRVATELGTSLPSGVTLSQSGVLSGTPTSTFNEPYFVVVATDANGAVTSGKIVVDNCVLTQQNGKFLIASRSDLQIFGIGACGRNTHYLQTQNITLTSPWLTTTTSEFPFTGTYDGQNYSITGLQITGDQKSFIPFTVGATISNLIFEATVSNAYGSAGLVRLAKSTSINNVHGSGSVSTPQTETDRGCVGGLAGETDLGTTIRNSSFTGTINAPNSSWNGGLIGCGYEGTVVEKSFFSGTVNGEDNVGGLVGWMDRTEIRNSFAMGSVSGTGVEIGGLIGWTDIDGTDNGSAVLENSYASVQVTGSNFVGSLIGSGRSDSVTSSYWEAGLNGGNELLTLGKITDQDGTQPESTSVSTSDMKLFAFFNGAGWSIHDGWIDSTVSPKIWGVCNNETRPFLLWRYSSNPCGTNTAPSPQPNTPSNPTTTVPSVPVSTIPSVPTSELTDSSTNLGPKLSTGGIEIFHGVTRINNSLSWAGASTISGKIGDIDLSIRFTHNQEIQNLPGIVAPGSTFQLSLRGLKANTNALATLFSIPMTLGTYKVSSKGELNSTIVIPPKTTDGSHRLRIQVIDQENRDITIWIGVRVNSSAAALPATGSSSRIPIALALWCLIIGMAFTSTAYSRSTLSRRSTRAKKD